MPLSPSNYTKSSKLTNYNSSDEEMDDELPFHSGYYSNTSSNTLNYRSYPTSLYSSSSSIPSSYSSITPFSRLPPQIPTSARRLTPIKRPYVDDDVFVERMPTQRRTPVAFQSRPLKNLTVLSKNERGTPVIRSVTRSPSPSISITSSRTRSVTPRRTFPQEYVRGDLDLTKKEESPVIFDANLTFVLGTKGKMRHNFTPLPAHMEDSTASSYLTNRIADFLKRTDHVMDEWKTIGRKKGRSEEEDNGRSRRSVGRSRSATNIMIKGFQLFSRASSCSRSSMARDISEDRTEADGEEVLLNIK